ncbi:uncharacterized protein LOC108165013 [Drosophila miranda]|uniref:uncharacterized protein LOC108165013 n=1 Tax=Drosophila miranda TaxID=7229 RepID=UPI0007E63F61|nr:uncharacterized protein LOC108165013 [Drosophila miranda]XP_017156539.1 uncharacterized protein LOC108165013 [Drosophila miranda]XP_033251089.1 uncharacterized protein LOC108165013 [Drosophila miranda]
MEPSSYVVKPTKPEKPMENKGKEKKQSTWDEDSFSAKRPKLDEEYQWNDKKQEAIKPVTDSKETVQITLHKLKEIMEKLSKRKVELGEDNVPSKKHKSKDDHNKDPKREQCSPAPGGLVFDRRDPFALTAEDEDRLRERPSMGIRNSLFYISAINIPEPAVPPKEKNPNFLHPKALFRENIDRIKKKKTSPTPFAFPYGQQSPERNVVRPEIKFWESIDHCDPTDPALPEKQIHPLMHPIEEESVSPYVFPDMKMDQYQSPNVVRPDTPLWAVTNYFDPIDPGVPDIRKHPIKEEKTAPFIGSPDMDQSPDSNVVPMTLFWESTNNCDPIIISRDPILAELPLPWPVLGTIPEPRNEKLSPSTFAFPYTPLWENMDNINPRETQKSPQFIGFPDMDQSPDAQMLARSHNWPQNMDSFDPNECPTPTDNSNGIFPHVWTFVAPVTAADDKMKKGPRTLRYPSKVDLSSRLLAKFPKLNNSNNVRTEQPSSADATIKSRPKKGPKIKEKAPGTYKKRKYVRKPKPEPVLVEVPSVEIQFVDLCDPASAPNEHTQELLFTTPDGSELHVRIDNLENSLVPWDGEAKVLYIEPFPIQTKIKRPRGRPPKRTIVPSENPLPLLDCPKSKRTAKTKQEPLDAIPKLGAEETEARPRITDAEEDALIADMEALLAEEYLGILLEAAEGQD